MKTNKCLTNIIFISLLLFFSSCISAEDLSSVEIITVTATKQSRSIIDTPSSVSVVDAELLKSINHQHINQSIQFVPGAWVSRGNGQEHLTAIRSPVLTGAGGCGAFFMALDGISLRAPGFCNANQLFDANSEQASRIEVLRGPSSTLYGSNALHGVINIISADLSNQNRTTTELELGANEFVRSKLALSTDIGKDKQMGVFANLTGENGYQDESGYDQQKATFIYQQKGDDWNNKTLVDVANLNQETAGFIQGFEVYKDPVARKQNPNPEAFRDAKSIRMYSRFYKQKSDSSYTITPYLRSNEMTFLQHFLPWKALEENRHQSIGLQTQLDLFRDLSTWTVGSEIEMTQGELKETQAEDFSPSIPSGDHYDYQVDATTIAGFIQGDWQLDQLSLIAGARLERIEFDYDNMLTDGSACALDVEVCRFVRPADQKVNYTTFSPSVMITYDMADNQMSYLKLAQGYRAPQATELFRLQNNQTIADLDTESMDSIELGYRYSNNKLNVFSSIYYQQKKDVIFQDSNRQNVIGGETSHRGLEVEVSAMLTESLWLASNYSFAIHKYESNFSFSRSDIKEKLIDTSPKHLFGAQLNWKINEAVQSSLRFSHTSKYFLNPENTAEYDGHSLLDLTVNYQVSNRFSVLASVYNILDTDYAERADFGFGNYRYFVGQPRRLFVNFRYDWNN